MRIVCISDTHCRAHLKELPEGDVLIHAGDLSLMGEPHEIQQGLAWLRKFPHAFKIVIGGNHDNALAEMPMLFEEQLKPFKNFSPIIYLRGTQTNIKVGEQSYSVFGSALIPFSAGIRFGARAFMSDGSTTRHWNYAPNCDILITHGPPKGIMDSVSPDSIDRAHFGDPALRIYVDRIKPKLHVFGHVHSARGIQEINGTKFVNASLLNEQYMPVNEPIVVDI
jgi:predicted phosphodiesterase